MVLPSKILQRWVCNVTRSNPEIKCDTNEFFDEEEACPYRGSVPVPFAPLLLSLLACPLCCQWNQKKKKAARENHQKSKNIYLERILLFLVGERGIKETEREKERVRSHEDQKKSFKRWNTIKIRIRRHKRTCASSDLHDSQLVVEVEMFRPGALLFSIIIIILIIIDL